MRRFRVWSPAPSAASKLVGDALDHEAANGGKKGSDAHKLLGKLGWTGHLDKSRATHQAKATKPKVTVKEVPAD